MDSPRLVLLASLMLFPVITLVFIALWLRARNATAKAQRSLEVLKRRFTPILSLEDEYERVEAEIAKAERELAEFRADYLKGVEEERRQIEIQVTAAQTDLTILRSNYTQKRALYDRLAAEVAIYDERLAFAEMGVYEPHFDFSDSEHYRHAIEVARNKQKDMISAKTAVYCGTKWSVDGSTSKGQTMTERNIRLTLRAFNNECEAAIANTRWNNVNAMEKRILKAKEQIDKLNQSNTVVIRDDFLKLKLEELYLTHEHREKLKAERDERAEAVRLEREEKRLLRDLEAAQEDEDHYARLLTKAKAEAAAITGERLEAFTQQIAILERDLAEAHAKADRAKAMAERTRSGYVYIVSNIGSFGHGIVKIGLTRRLDPLDRIRELGDASVPFSFDTHAIIYSENAPALEHALHSRFEPTRLNLQNTRKEFFRATLDEVETAVTHLAPDAAFFKDIEAQEYQETLSRRRQALETSQEKARTLLPEAI